MREEKATKVVAQGRTDIDGPGATHTGDTVKRQTHGVATRVIYKMCVEPFSITRNSHKNNDNQ